VIALIRLLAHHWDTTGGGGRIAPNGMLMPYFAFLVTAIVLAIFLVPVLLTRRDTNLRAEDHFVSSDYVLPKVIQNASIAYAIGLATLGPFFAWGASGAFWQALIYAAFIGLGLSLIYFLRRPMLQFLDRALNCDRSVTVHGFIARQHGNDPRVGMVAAVLTLSALSGLVICEVLGIATVLKTMLANYAAFTDLVIAAVLVIVMSCTILSGHAGIMHAAQLQLGLLYFGLFASTIFLLYQQISELGIMAARGNVAIELITVVCVVMLLYRRGRYVDSDSIRFGASIDAIDARKLFWLRMLRRFQKILNSLIGILIVSAFGVSAFILYIEDFPTIVNDSFAAMLAGSNVSGMTLVSFVLLSLFHPIVDIVNWQRLAVFAKDRDWNYFRQGQWAAAFKSFCTAYSVEVPLTGLLICLFGAVAGLTLGTSDRGDVAQAFVAQLTEEYNLVTIAVLSCLLFGLLAMAVATIGALFSASLCAVRYDIVPLCWPGPITPLAREKWEAHAGRLTRFVGAGIGLVDVAAFYLADMNFEVTFASGRFLVLVLAFGCIQLSFVPLVLGPLIVKSGRRGTVNPGWAITVMAVGAATGIGATAIYLSTGYDSWQWVAVPGCLGSGALIFATARLWLRRTEAVVSSARQPGCDATD
jgi:hypothetical protein